MTQMPGLEMIRHSLRQLLDEIAPPEAVGDWDSSDRIRRELVERLGALDVCGVTLAADFGGLGSASSFS